MCGIIFPIICKHRLDCFRIIWLNQGLIEIHCSQVMKGAVRCILLHRHIIEPQSFATIEYVLKDGFTLATSRVISRCSGSKNN